MADIYSPEAQAMYRRPAEDAARWTAAAQGKPYIPAEIPISQVLQYQQGREQAQLAYELGGAQNEYNRGQQQSRYTNFEYPDLVRKFDQMREQLPGQFAGRGLLNSGIWMGALGKYNTERQFGLGHAEFEQQSKMGQFDINKQALERTYQQARQQIDSQEAAARQDLAAQIRAFA